MGKVYLKLSERVEGAAEKVNIEFEAVPCDSDRCVFAPYGYCLAPLFRHGKPPVVTEEGCFQAVDREVLGMEGGES